uniref:G_PROTEIN_RECEP_F1_2 domain-containing protein n=1 Tax=Bursaphelenchus xylophilus TaxID=6326 RepID=A0A1I7RR49_BURXY
MTLPDPRNCTEALIVSTHWALILIFIVHLLLSILFLVILFFLVANGSLFRFFAIVHPNLKILLQLSAFFGVLHSIFVIILRSSSLTAAFRNLPECDYQWRPVHCLSLKLPIYYCVFSFTVIHFSLFIERAYATCFLKYYQSGHRWLGSFLTSFIILITSVSIAILYCKEDLETPRSYCLSTTMSTAPRLQFTMVCAGILDLIVTVGDAVVYKVNVRRNAKTCEHNPEVYNCSLKHRFSEYSLNRSYQMRENKMSLLIILPLSVVHSTFFLSYLFISFVARSLIVYTEPVTHVVVIEMMQTAVCTYLVVIAIALNALWMRTEKQLTVVQNQGNGGDVHFQQLRIQFEQVVPLRR